MNTLYNKHISEYIRSHFGLKTLDVATEFLDLVTSQCITREGSSKVHRMVLRLKLLAADVATIQKAKLPPH